MNALLFRVFIPDLMKDPSRVTPAVGSASKPGFAPAGDSLSLASPRESKQREGDPMVWDPPLRYGQPAVLAENGVRHKLASLKQVPALIRFRLRSSAQPDGWVTNAGTNPESLKRAALQGGDSQRTVMFARERSARDHMKSPSIAQRGEGGVRGGSGELKLLFKACRGRSVMQLSVKLLPAKGAGK